MPARGPRSDTPRIGVMSSEVPAPDLPPSRGGAPGELNSFEELGEPPDRGHIEPPSSDSVRVLLLAEQNCAHLLFLDASAT